MNDKQKWNALGKDMAKQVVTEVAVHFLQRSIDAKEDIPRTLVSGFATAVHERRGMGFLDSLSIDDQHIFMRATMVGLLLANIEMSEKVDTLFALIQKKAGE